VGLLGLTILVLFALAFGATKIMWEHRHVRPVTLVLGALIAIVAVGAVRALADDWLGAAVSPAIAVLLAFMCWSAYYFVYPAR
jgi:hypothetical protein